MNNTTAGGTSADALHTAWVQKREAAIAIFFAERQADLANWFAIADTAETPDERSIGAALVRMATVVADCVGAHAAAADAYFRLAQSMEAGDEPDPSARRWYTRSLAHAEQAGNDFGVARSTYCLGVIDAAEGRDDDAVGHFTQAREYAERAGNAAGKAAAFYRLALLAMAKEHFDVALKHAFESYLVSREAKQYLAGAATLAVLFEFLARVGLDSFAESPDFDLLSQAVVSVSEKAEDGRLLGLALHALAPLNAETRAAILRAIGERFGAEVAEVLGHELEAAVALLRSPGSR